jgi:hypothetical protein
MSYNKPMSSSRTSVLVQAALQRRSMKANRMEKRADSKSPESVGDEVKRILGDFTR